MSGKLVRSQVIEHMLNSGVHPEFSHVKGEEHLRRLKDKLLEECVEVFSAEGDRSLIEEIADVREVLDVLVEVSAFSEEDVQLAQEEKRNRNGSFRKGVVLEQYY